VLARKETGAAAAAATVIAHLNGAFISGPAPVRTARDAQGGRLERARLVSGDTAVPGVLPALYLAASACSSRCWWRAASGST